MAICGQSTKPSSSGSSLRSVPSEERAAHEHRGRCILVAEDDADDVFLLRRAWRKAGLLHRLMDVADGIMAVGFLSGRPPFDDRAQYPFPELLLLDLNLPKMNGFDVLAWLKERPDMNSLPVVVLSSSSMEADQELAMRMGAREFLTKPGDVNELIALLRGLHERWLVDDRAVPQSLSVAQEQARVESMV